MPAVLLWPNAGLLWQTNLLQTALAESVVRLFKGEVSIGPTTTLAMLQAAECDFSGYPADGIELTAWNEPILAPEGGMALLSPSVMFATADPTTTGNVVTGWWVETATTPKLVVCGTFDDGIPMQVPSQGLPLQIRLVFPYGT